jgi:hypothetical protein
MSMRIAVLICTSLSLAVVGGCGVHKIPLESDATFGMHQENRKFVVDQPVSGTPSLVTPASWFRTPGGPAWALRHEGKTLAGYWLDGDAHITARAGLRFTDRLLGGIRPTWDANAIRLRLDPAEGQPVQSDVFTRIDAADGTAFSRSAQTILDVRGRYQAALRDTQGKQVGWLRLRIGPYGPAPRIYEAALPAGVSDDLAVAAMLALADEIDWIEGHTVDVYQGGGRGPLIQSVPIR